MLETNIMKMIDNENSKIVAIQLNQTIYTEFGISKTGLFDIVEQDQEQNVSPCLVLKGLFNTFQIIPMGVIMQGKVSPDNQSIEFGKGHVLKLFKLTPVFVDGEQKELVDIQTMGKTTF